MREWRWSATPLYRAPRLTTYTCPMHPEVEQDHPGNCPICGMSLEPKNVATGGEDEDRELRDMTRRFWIGATLAVPVFLLAMSHLWPSAPDWVQADTSRWIQFLLSTPVVLWAGWPFFVRGWRSIAQRSLNMFTLISIGRWRGLISTARSSCSCRRPFRPLSRCMEKSGFTSNRRR
jgi:Cu+-exporting ATPase